MFIYAHLNLCSSLIYVLFIIESLIIHLNEKKLSEILSDSFKSFK